MSGRERFFLVIFDRAAGESSVDDLGTDAAAAMEAYEASEHELAGRDGIEVALLGSSSLETLRRTHSSYFGAAERARGAAAP
jgi:hypothetical protein